MGLENDRLLVESGWDCAERLIAWINALDTSNMSAKEVRSKVHEWALTYTPYRVKGTAYAD